MTPVPNQHWLPICPAPPAGWRVCVGEQRVLLQYLTLLAPARVGNGDVSSFAHISCRAVLQLSSLDFQRFPVTLGESMRHEMQYGDERAMDEVSLRDTALERYRELIKHHEKILSNIDAGKYAFEPADLASFRTQQESFLREFRLLHDVYSEHVLDNRGWHTLAKG
jgi:hypothetical protein